MAEPSNPHNVEGENPEQPVVVEEEEEGAAGGGLPALKWTRKTFDRLMLDVQMPPEYGAQYPSEGDTGADAPAGYVTMWADFFGDCNLRLPLTVFVVDVLEWYKVHISQMSPFGMIRIRNFEFTFRALGIEPTVGDFRRFYQMTVSLGFFSFRQRDGSPKLMTPPKGMTMWKKKFFYVKAAAIVADMTFRNVTETIIGETIAMPSLKSVQWFPQLQTIESVKLTNTQLWLLHMMLTRRNKNSRPVVREKSGEHAPAWRMFAPDFHGTVETVVCADGEEDHNAVIRSNFRVPTEAALAVELPPGKGDLGALGDPISVKALQAKADALKALGEAKEAGARALKALEEAAEKESRASKALEEANAKRIRLGKVVESLQAEVQAREVAVTDLTARVSAAEKRADAAAEAKDALVSSFNQLEADREWLRTHGIARIVEAIMNAPETASGLDLVKERARDAGFKAGYNRCIGHINVLSAGGYTDQASGFRDVDTEGRLKAAVTSFYDTPLACVGELDDCLEVADYVDRLRMLYPDVEEEEPAGGAGGDAGTSGTK
ncbi:hypothetical protein HanIR_Chr12g0561741 [Helianthus annuus]|nr:hypothetical protein HanIR_Chr12g0561741 [Helianthus annuus]